MNKLLMTILILTSFTGYTATTAKTALTDQQIEKIVMNTNNGEIALAKMAQKNSQNPEVKKFAQEMIDDHTNNNQKSLDLVKKTNTKPEDNDKSIEMKTAGEKSLVMLKDLKGAAFDKAYVTNQVATHEKVLNELDNNLIPSAKNEELRALLTKTREKVAEHVKHAKRLQSTL